jgi:hypothetical protein
MNLNRMRILPAADDYDSRFSNFNLFHVFKCVVRREETPACPLAYDPTTTRPTYVGNISAIRTKALPSIRSGAFTAVASANGTRTYSAWAPSRAAVPKSILLAHLEENPCLQ